MTRVFVVIGTRPEAIKLAPVVRALRAAGPDLDTILCATAQHRQMLDQVLELFAIRPDIDLNVMREGQTLAFITTEILTRLQPILREHRPDVVVVQGDTTTTMASGLAAFYEQIPVAHVEAGLRTNDPYSPYPEEMNRRITTQLAAIHFAATARAARALIDEGVAPSVVFLTGNPVVDAVQHVRRRMEVAGAVALRPGQRLVLVTAHRRESFGEPIRQICRAILAIVDQFPDVEVVYPVHPNPEIVGPVTKLLGDRDRVHLLGPVGYDEFVALLDRAYLVLSDSGGVQEEAPVLGTPLLILRDKTERLEAIESGSALLVGTDCSQIVAAAQRLLTSESVHSAMAQSHSPFGDGHAAERIVGILLQLFAGRGSGADEHRFPG